VSSASLSLEPHDLPAPAPLLPAAGGPLHPERPLPGSIGDGSIRNSLAFIEETTYDPAYAIEKQGRKRMPRSANTPKWFVFFLISFLSAILADGPDDFSYALDRVKAIGSCTQFANSDAEGDCLAKGNVFDRVDQNPGLHEDSLSSEYSYLCMESWSPRDAYLPIESDRAPPVSVQS
jgi:hypothetical protein